MKNDSVDDPDMLDEYDFSSSEVVIGKYAARYAEGTNVVLLDPDVAKMFSDSKSVNRALRAIGKIAKDVKVPSTTRGSKRARKDDPKP